MSNFRLCDYIEKRDLNGFVELFEKQKINEISVYVENKFKLTSFSLTFEYFEDNGIVRITSLTPLTELLKQCEINNNDAIAMYLISLFDFDETKYYHCHIEYAKKMYNKLQML